MAQKNIKIGQKEFKYNLPNNPRINKYIIKVYNETLKQLSYYFFTEIKKWSLVANDDDCLIMTIYGTTENGKVLTKDFLLKKPNSGKIEKLSNRPDQSEWRNIYIIEIECNLEEFVPAPKISYPVFYINPAQESNSHTNYYVQFLKDGDTKFIKLATSENNEIIDKTIKLQSRRSYGYKLYKVNKTGRQFVVNLVTGETLINFNSRNCHKDVKELMEKAILYVKEMGVYNVRYLYRNKPSSHSTIIKSKKTGIMNKYLKDNNGDPYSSINGNICGLHFSATPINYKGDLPPYSYFGDYRIMIFPKYLVKGCNLYFADFYCMFSSSSHWVLLVLTKRGSEEDKFCQHRLVKLDIENNPFFYKSEEGYKVTYVFCEILYTEDINLKEMKKKEGFKEEYEMPLRGPGKSTPGGIRKKPSCEICNLPSN